MSVVTPTVSVVVVNYRRAAELDQLLAKSVAVSNNGLTHTFKLRDDAFFHNGKKMTADDVVYSFTRIMDGKRAFPGARWARIIKGAVDVEKGQATTIEGLK